ncbi:MAG: type III polyketide synthase, partial [Micromonosporaceae bacterium]
MSTPGGGGGRAGDTPVAVLAGFGVAQPGTPVPQSVLWDDYFATRIDHSPGARRIFMNTGVSSRYATANPVREDISPWSTQRRMQRYAAEAPPLGRAAVTQALDSAGLAATDVGLFAVASCTGYTTPGVDITLATELGMGTDVQRLGIGHMGCYAALPGIGAVCDYVVARERPAVLLCVELPSLHVQPPSRDLGQVVAHGLFSDAAAAVVVRPQGAAPSGLALLDLVALTDPATGDHMTWQVTDHGFRMGLSPRVADVLAKHVPDLVGKLLARHGLAPADVAAWAVHPGGPRILDVVES